MFDIEKLKEAMPPATFELFIDAFSKMENINKWTLVGGTALAIHLQHRLSEDLDFFIEKSTLEQENSNILDMITSLEKQGYDCILTENNDRNLNYLISEVKVTFFASGLKHLKNNCSSYENINVADIDIIIAMKIEAIIFYRIKTRDFYDIWSICKEKGISLFAMLDVFNKNSTKKATESLILQRLTKVDLDGDDEGLSGMIKGGSSSSIEKIRLWVKEQIKDNKKNENSILEKIVGIPSFIEENKDFYFGLERFSLPQKLASIGEYNLVSKCLELNIFDTTYRSISNKNLLDFYLLPEDENMFIKVLEYTKEIPSDWLESKVYGREDKVKYIKLENAIINSINKKHTEDRMKIVSMKHDINIEDYMRRVQNKKKIL